MPDSADACTVTAHGALGCYSCHNVAKAANLNSIQQQEGLMTG